MVKISNAEAELVDNALIDVGDGLRKLGLSIPEVRQYIKQRLSVSI